MRTTLDLHQHLIDGSINGDRKAQKDLFDLYNKAMFNIGVRLLGNFDDAADITQETFIDVFTKIDQYQGKATFGAWIKRIMINKSINHLNRRKVHFSLSDNEPIEDEVNSDKEDREQLMYELNASISTLPEGCRVIFTLYYFEGYDHQEISTILGISLSTSKSQLSRAKQLLRANVYQKINA
ncbi:MAG: RNA polymerase sigma factor [Crocinitomicaceae bacterium]